MPLADHFPGARAVIDDRIPSGVAVAGAPERISAVLDLACAQGPTSELELAAAAAEYNRNREQEDHVLVVLLDQSTGVGANS